MKNNTQGKYEHVLYDLRKSLAWIDLVLANLSEGIFVVGEDFKIYFANDSAAFIVGRERVLLMGLPIWEALPLIKGKDAVGKDFFVDAVINRHSDTISGTYYFVKNGNTLILEVKVRLIEKIRQRVFWVNDITKQRKQEEAFRQEQIALIREQVARDEAEKERTLLQTIIDGSNAVIYLKDVDGRYLMINKQHEKLFSIKRDEVKGKTDFDIFPKEIAENFRANDQEVLKTKKTLHKEELAPHDDGLHTYISVKFPLFDSKDEPYAVCGISTDITERKEIEKRKDDFINMASHELKTPVTSMKIFNNVVKDLAAKGDINRIVFYSSKIGTQLERLTKLISELLNLSRIQSGKLALEKDFFDFNDLVKEMVENVQITTKKHSIFIEGSIDRKIYGDRDRIGQVITNFISNAVKYSPDGGTIFVQIDKEDERVKFSVQDFGIGIAKKYHAKIFERFFQVTESKEKTFPGLGIGLFIASEIIKRHGGSLDVESAKGKGSTFIFTLPVGQL